MPMEPYYEVMQYWEARAKRTEVSAALVTNVGQAASGIVSSILLLTTGATLDSLKPQLKSYMGQKLGVAHALSVGAINDVPDTIEDDLEVDYKFMIDALKAGLGQGVGGLHSSLYGLLAGTDALLGGYEGIIQQVGINPFISRWVNQTVKPNIPDAETAWLMWRLGNITEGDYKTYAAQNGWSNDWLSQMNYVWLTPPPIGVLLDLYRRGLITVDDFNWRMRLARFDEKTINTTLALSVQYPEPYRLAEMRSKGLINDDDYLATTRIFGLQDVWAENWAEDQVKYPDFNTALALLRREVIDNMTFLHWMKLNQIDIREASAMLTLKDVIPPIQDLIRFAVREAYGDHSSEVQYPTMVNIAKKMGLSEEASSWYWYAHWDRIPVNLMYANYYRGLWDVDKLMRMLKIVDVHPDDRQDIINVAYGPPSIREMGYGFDVGVYSEDDIVRYRRWGGLSPEDAAKSGKAMVAYRTETERNSIRTELMYALGDDRIDAETFIQKLLELNTPEAAIDLWVERAELYRERVLKPTTDVEGRTVSSSEALTAFKLGLRDESWTREMLAKLFWTVERIDTAVERAKLEMEQDKAKAEEVKYRKLTIAQITNSYGLGLITKEDMTTEFIIIGYSPDDAELLTAVYTAPKAVTAAIKNYTITDAVKLYRYQLFDETDIYENYLLEGYDSAHSAMLTLMTKLDYDYPILASLYEKGYINLEQITFELKKMGLDEKHIKLLLDRTMYTYQVSRLASEKDLTKAEILKGAKNNVFSLTEAVGLLEGIGYDENEAYYLLAINKIVVAGDPDGYWEMRRATELYKKARGEAYVTIPDELIMLETQLKMAKANVDELRKMPEKEEEIKNAALALNTVEQRMRELISKLGLK
jgi:hypothetical protein